MHSPEDRPADHDSELTPEQRGAHERLETEVLALTLAHQEDAWKNDDADVVPVESCGVYRNIQIEHFTDDAAPLELLLWLEMPADYKGVKALRPTVIGKIAGEVGMRYLYETDVNKIAGEDADVLAFVTDSLVKGEAPLLSAETASDLARNLYTARLRDTVLLRQSAPDYLPIPASEEVAQFEEQEAWLERVRATTALHQAANKLFETYASEINIDEDGNRRLGFSFGDPEPLFLALVHTGAPGKPFRGRMYEFNTDMVGSEFELGTDPDTKEPFCTKLDEFGHEAPAPLPEIDWLRQWVEINQAKVDEYAVRILDSVEGPHGV